MFLALQMIQLYNAYPRLRGILRIRPEDNENYQLYKIMVEWPFKKLNYKCSDFKKVNPFFSFTYGTKFSFHLSKKKFFFLNDMSIKSE